MTGRFILTDENGNIIVEKNEIGRLILWLNEHSYFAENPNATLTMTEQNTVRFSAEVKADTTSRELIGKWKSFMGFV